MHTADWQIGMTRRFLSPEAQARFAAARIDVVRRLGRLASDEGCDFVLVCGDVFEHDQLTPQTLRRTLEALRAVEVPVYLLPGNHDHLGPMSVWSTSLMSEELPDHVHVLDRPGVHEVRPGVEIVAVPWQGKHPQEDLVGPVLDDLSDPAEGTVRVLAAHGIVDLLDQERRHRAAIPTDVLRSSLDSGLVHYVGLGDRHSRTEVADGIWYSGAPEPTAWREVSPGDALVVEVEPPASGRGRGTVRVTPHHVAAWSFVTVERRVDGDADIDALDAELAALPDKDRVLVHLGLRGTLGLAQHARLEELLARHEDVLGALHRPPQHSDLVLAGDDDIAELGLGGFLASAVEDMRSMAGTGDQPDPEDEAAFAAGRPDDGSSARDALQLLYRLARGGAR
ncbi:metallophosphoesterase family protein [Ornithinimicrobium tianjinense]|uniref:metallophosphoesterase family protein n=1 Tax=Ornithinimicrobium tianjinense TaxID=1195761 RepID=UPI001E5218AE|nr:metallophosphoesterase [Ornithinimicrobium tianjinense]